MDPASQKPNKRYRSLVVDLVIGEWAGDQIEVLEVLFYIFQILKDEKKQLSEVDQP